MVKSICIVISDYYKEISDGLETGATNFCAENSIKYSTTLSFLNSKISGLMSAIRGE